VAFAEAIMRIFLAHQKRVKVALTNSRSLSKPIMATGASDIRLPVAKLIADGAKVIVIISDGYENQGHLDDVVKAAKRFGVTFYHINPVTAVESGVARSFSDEVKPLVVSGIEQLPAAGIIDQLCQNPKSLEQYIDGIYEAFKSGQIQQARDLATFKNQPINLLGIAA